MTLTFLAALTLVARVADAGAHDAGTMAAAGHVDALVGRHVTLGTLPATVAQASALHVLAIPTAQHGAGGWRDSGKSLGESLPGTLQLVSVVSPLSLAESTN